MAAGRRKSARQADLWVSTGDLARSPGHPFYERVDRLLVEDRCAKFYAEKMGRPGLPPSVYVRMLPVGYFEGLDSERGIAWRCADSLALGSFLGLNSSESPVDHLTVSRTRRLIDLETRTEIFGFVLKLLAERGLVKGETIGIDATTLEANASMKSIVRLEDRQTHNGFLVSLAKSSGIETSTREDLARIDRNRPGKGSNDDWQNPRDPDAQITKMKDGSTHLAHKAEHAVDMKTGAVLAVTIQPGATGDTTSVLATLTAVTENVVALLKDPAVAKKVCVRVLDELVTDKGYHSNDTISTLASIDVRGYISEPDRGRRRWRGVLGTRNAVDANRLRVKGSRGKALMHGRGEYPLGAVLRLEFLSPVSRRAWLRRTALRVRVRAAAAARRTRRRPEARRGCARGLAALPLDGRAAHALVPRACAGLPPGDRPRRTRQPTRAHVRTTSSRGSFPSAATRRKVQPGARLETFTARLSGSSEASARGAVESFRAGRRDNSTLLWGLATLDGWLRGAIRSPVPSRAIDTLRARVVPATVGGR